MLQRGDHVPHFEVSDIAGRPVCYAAIWQSRPLVLVCFPPSMSAAADDYSARLTARTALLDDDVSCVVTRDSVAGVDPPAVVIADQWGEVAHVATVVRPQDLPDPEEVLDWVQFLRIRCPECEGEAR